MGFGLQNYGGFLTVQWPIFTGFGEENKVRLADTQRLAAVEELSLAKEKTTAEVWRAYTRAKNALARADGLVKATRAGYDALAGFDQGLAAVQDVLTAQAAWSQAIALQAESDCAIGATLAALAFGSGKARRRYPPRPIATPVSSAPTSTIVHPSRKLRCRWHSPNGSKRKRCRRRSRRAIPSVQAWFERGLVPKCPWPVFVVAPAMGECAVCYRKKLQASQHALPLCSNCLRKLVPRIGGLPGLLEFLKGHWRALVRLDDVLGNFLGRR